MKKHLMIALTLLTLLPSCSKKNEAPAVTEQAEAKAEPKTELEQLKELASKTSNGSSITDIIFQDGIATLVHTTSYAEYKKLNPNSRMLADGYASLWTEKDLYYTLNVTPHYIMHELPFVKQVITKVKYTDGKVYSTDVTREGLQAFLGNPVDLYDTKDFRSKYVWDKEGCAKFFAKFGKVE